MPSYVTPKRGVAFKLFVGLADRNAAGTFKNNPTLAAGDFKVSIDGGALANLATLPSASPASSRQVMIDLSAAEMTGDNITVEAVDAAGAEWDDVIINIQTTARQIDDLAYPAVSGRSLTVDASGRVDVGTWLGAAVNALIGGRVDANAQVVGDKTAYTLSAAGVQAIWDALTTALTTVGSIGKRLADFITGDAFVRLGAPAGASVSADIAALPTAVTNADTLLNRDMATGTDSGSTTVRTVRQALRFLRNKRQSAAGTLTVFKEDDATTSWTAALTTDAAAVPVVTVDPAGP